MPSGVSGLIGGLQGGQQQTNPYAGAPGLNQQQAANILQQLRSGAGIGNGGATMMGALPAGANPQAALSQMVQQAPPQNTMTALPAGASPQQGALAMMGLNPQNTMAALPAGASYQGMPANTMQGFGGFGGMAPLQANAYAGNPQQTALQSMARGLGGRSPVQPQAYAQNPYAFMGF